MFFKRGGDRWHLRIDPEGGVGFCVWALQGDGLRVPPFDRHPDGDGSLRAAGLTAEHWWAWFAAVLDLHRRMNAWADAGASPPRALAEPAYRSYLAWHEGPAVAARLAELWRPYDAARDTRRRWYADAEAPWRLQPRDFRRWWRQLAQVRGELPPLSLHLVGYPALVVLPDAPLQHRYRREQWCLR